MSNNHNENDENELINDALDEISESTDESPTENEIADTGIESNESVDSDTEEENTDEAEASAENDNSENSDNEKGEADTPEQPKKSISISKIAKSVSNFFNRTGLTELTLVRFIAVFFLISGTNISTIKDKVADGVNINPVGMWKEFVPMVNGPLTIILMASVFVLMSLVYYIMPKAYRITDQLFAIASILYFDIVLLWKTSDFNLSFGTMMVSVVFIYYCFGKIKQRKKLDKLPWWICGIIVLLCASAVSAFVAVTTIMCHKAFGTACHDFGLFVQMYHSLANDGTAVTTCERDVFMSHFKIHASYIFYALVPFFKMSPKPETLLISQAILSMGGVIPMFLIAKRHKFKSLSLMFMGLAYVFCIGIVAPCYYEFHENAFLPTILMWLLWAVDRKNYILFYVMSVLTCIVKEDAPLYVISIGLFLFFEDKGKLRRINGLAMAIIAGVYMVFITNWLTDNGDGQMMMSSRFSILMIDMDGGLKEVVKNSLADPAYLFSLLVKEETTRFFLQVMVPFLFIPFFTRKIERFLLMIPFIVMNLVIGAGYGYAANVGFQYIFGPSCLLLYMCLINISDMGQRNKQNIAVAFGSAAIILTIGTCSHRINNIKNYENNKDYYVSLETMLDSIPKGASVATDTFLVPHVADHKEVYIFDSGDYNEEGTMYEPERYDFVVIPVRTDHYENEKNALSNSGYILWSEIEGKCQVYMSPNYS